VSQKTIDAISFAIARDGWSKTDKTQQAIGQLLWDLNVDSYNDRYPGENAPYMPYTAKKKNLTDIHLYRVLSGYIYQCSEGDLVDCELYLAVIAFKIKLANKIISSIPGYDDLSRDL
jgi:hypothetical protein